MFGMKKNKEKLRLDAVSEEFKKLTNYLGLEQNQSNFIPFTPDEIFLCKEDGNEFPGHDGILKMIFSIAQSNSSTHDLTSYWNNKFFSNYKQKQSLVGWARSCLDDDIVEACKQSEEIRLVTWENSTSKGYYSEIDDEIRLFDYKYIIKAIKNDDFHKLNYEMIKADIISMRACKEQGARWGIRCTFNKMYDEILYNENLLKHYKIPKTKWKKTSEAQLEKNYKKMLK